MPNGQQCPRCARVPQSNHGDVYTALRGIDFAVLFDDALGPINRTSFDAWHADAIQAMIEKEPRLTVGWATKIINVYLKTRVYIGAQGRPYLKEMIHPLIDAGSMAWASTPISKSP